MTAPAPPGWLVKLTRAILVSLGLGVLFAFLGVYETSQFPFGVRIMFWSGLIGLGFASSAFISPWVFDGPLSGQPTALQLVVAAALIALPVTAGLLLIDAADGRMAAPRSWPVQYIYALTISLIMAVGGWVAERLTDQRAAPPPSPGLNAAQGDPAAADSGASDAASSPPSAAAVALSERLPVRLRTAAIHAVSAEDHYLRVHTSGGEELILLRLSDAIRELGGLDGLQVHRSWWVARQGVAEVKRDDGKLALKLKSGAEAPVSRTYARAVRDAGWV